MSLEFIIVINFNVKNALRKHQCFAEVMRCGVMAESHSKSHATTTPLRNRNTSCVSCGLSMFWLSAAAALLRTLAKHTHHKGTRSSEQEVIFNILGSKCAEE